MTRKIFIISQQELPVAVGGSCTVNYDFCDLLTENGFEVTDILFSEYSERPKGFNDKVNYINLYDKEKTFAQKLDEYLSVNKPDLFVFFFPALYVQANLSKKYDNIPRILMFHSRPDYYFYTENSLKNLEAMYTNTVTQILFPSYYNLLPSYIRKNKVVLIPNYAKSQSKINSDIENKKIIYLSRLDIFKQIKFLIHSFSLASKKIPDWTLDIYGQATEEYYIELNDLIKSLSMIGKINIKGITNNPIATMKNYDFCVFPSSFEGFPMGLIEAQSVGLPCIGLEKCTGVNELIIDKFNGYTVKYNEKVFCNAIIQLANDRELRKTLSNNTYTNVQKYNKAYWDKLWLDTISKVINNEKLVYKNTKINKKVFSMQELFKMANYQIYNTFIEKLFSVKKFASKTIIYILGFKITLKAPKTPVGVERVTR